MSSPIGWSPYSQPRSSRSCRRASDATRRGSAACRWISASVCSTESCTRAATSERSSLRIRAVRSASRSIASRHTQGPAISSSAPTTAPGASRVEDVALARQQHDRAQRGEREPAVGQRRVRAKAAALAQRERDPRRDQRDPEHRPVGEAERGEEQRAGHERQHGRTQTRPLSE